MPTYEYRCPEGHEFERFYRKMGDATDALPCPICGKEATRRLTGGAGLVFKGSGFYLTDYGKNAHRGGSGPSTTASSGESSSGDKSSGDSGGSSASSASTSGGGESKPSGESKSSESKSSDAKPKGNSASTGSGGSKSDKA